ncbi:MAG: hypothetical protein JF622_17095 [Terrabacter sp.]|nr:hypothetical protein [Terrabacter sp.]
MLPIAGIVAGADSSLVGQRLRHQCERLTDTLLSRPTRPASGDDLAHTIRLDGSIQL